MEETDVIILWGSNAREAHPIYFHHVLKAVKRGAQLFVVDPRRTPSAQWADAWLPLQVGSDISLANGVGRVILEEGLANEAFLARATEGLDAYRKVVDAYPLDRVERETGVRPQLVRQLARAFAKADQAMICWTLGITEHHNAVDNVLSLINLSLLTGHVGKWGSGLNPLRGQNNVQGGGDMGALPHKLPGFLDVEDAANRARCESVWGGKPIPPKKGWHLTQMFEAMEKGDLKAVYIIGENPVQSEADAHRTTRLLQSVDFLVVQDIFLTKTAQLADVVLPATSAWCETEGTVTNSERRVQRVRKAIDGPAGARDDVAIIAELSRRFGYPFTSTRSEDLWNELRRVSPMHTGMSYEALAADGLQWPVPHDGHPGTPFLHGRLHQVPLVGPKVKFHPAQHEGPVEALSPEYPVRLTTGRRLDSYNTGVQTAALRSPGRRGETVDMCPADAKALGVQDGEPVRVVSRRGTVVAPVRYDEGMQPGLVFMTYHFPDQVPTNVLTIDATDLRAGTAEFKAAAIRIERLG